MSSYTRRGEPPVHGRPQSYSRPVPEQYDRVRQGSSSQPYGVGRSYRPGHFSSRDAQHSQPAAPRTWSSSGNSNYEAILQADDSDRTRTARQATGGRRGDRPLRSRGIKGKDFGYALISKEAESYAQTELRDQLHSVVTAFAVGGEAAATAATSPSGSASKLTPQDVVTEFKRAGHFDATRKQLIQAFQSSNHHAQLLRRLEAHLLKRISDMPPDVRHRLAGKDQRLQLSDLTSMVEESADAADIFDELFVAMQDNSHTGQRAFLHPEEPFAVEVDSRLADVLRSEKLRIEGQKADSSDEEGSTTTVNRGSGTPAYDFSSRGSQTPLAPAAS